MKSNSFLLAFKEVYFNKKYYYLTILFFLLFVSLYVAIPITLTPGHSLSFFFEITSTFQWFVTFSLSLTLGILLTFQVYFWKNLKLKKGSSSFGAGFAGFTAFLISIGSCMACSITLLTLFLPVTGALFLSQYIIELSVLAILLSLFSIYLTARAIIGYCKRCIY